MPGAEEVHVHHLARDGAGDDLVDVYLFEGEGRLSYLSPRAERPPGVSWVARTRRSFLAADAEEFAASVPRLTATGEMSCALLLPVVERAEVEAVVMLVRRVAAIYEPAPSSSRARSSSRGRRRWRSCARARRRAPTRSPAA